MNLIIILFTAGGLLLGGLVGYFLRRVIALAQRRSIEIDIKQMMMHAREEATNIIDDARGKAEFLITEAKEEAKIREHEQKKTEERLIKKESLLDDRQRDIDRDADAIKRQIEEIKEIRTRAEALEASKEAALEQIAGLTEEDARDILLKTIEERYASDLIIRMQKLESGNTDFLNRRAKTILASAVNRLATSTASELTTTTVILPSDEIKGKIIGKEGRNIKTFERIAGVELVIDDTPNAIVVSSFDPIRRHTARIALERLIADGRIQPAKIEEMLAQAKEDINSIIKEKGSAAVHECGIYNLDPRIVAVLGRLHFRTSYGQNVLQHSIEVAHIAGMLAEELGGDVAIAKAGALVHDIGKALDHEVQGTHIDIGIRVLQKFGADPRIITAMKSHHDDCPHETIEAVIVQTSDYISGGRPGARSDTVENYLKRLAELESLVNAFDGIDKTYAIQAGREIRVFVSPDKVSDMEAHNLARSIADRIESELRYPGEIKVTLIRENRIIEYAR